MTEGDQVRDEGHVIGTKWASQPANEEVENSKHLHLVVDVVRGVKTNDCGSKCPCRKGPSLQSSYCIEEGVSDKRV